MVFLIIPNAHSYPADPRGNHKQREELRRGEWQLEQLQRRLNEGDP